MRIRSIQAFPIRSDMVGALHREGAAATAGRRPPWTADAEVAGPMSGYPRFKKLRSSWRYDGAVGCLATAQDGSWGFGVTRYDRPVIHLINDHFAPRLEGENALTTERAWDMMTRMSAPYGPGGLAAYATAAVDLALWDLKGKLLRQPVFALVGGPVREELACYATGNDTDWHMELGFRGTKLACPYGPHDGLAGLARTEALVGRARELVGPEVELMLDCWMALDVEHAVRLAHRVRPYGLRWIEDCLMPDDLAGQKRLRERLPWIGLATGEHWYVAETFLQAASQGLADILQPDICWAGGFTGCRRIVQIAEAAGLEVILHAGANTPYGQHLSVTSPAIRWAEYFLGSAPGVPLAEARVFPGAPVPDGGSVAPSPEPGFGLGLDEAAIDAMRR